MNIDLSTNSGIITTVAGLTISATLGYVAAYQRENLAWKFSEKRRKHNHKLNVAQELIDTVLSATNDGYRGTMPSELLILKLSNNIFAIDENISDEFSHWYAGWALINSISKIEKPEKETKELIANELKEMGGRRRLLLKWANKIRMGKSHS